MPTTTRGEREVALRFDTFPMRARKALEARIERIIDTLESRSQSAAPYRRGELRSEIHGRVFADQPTRIAGYVSVFARDTDGYAKAATLEYGSDKPRHHIQRLLGGRRRRSLEAFTRPVHIKAYAYLRGPFAAMRGEIDQQLAEAMTQVEAEEPT